MQGAVSRKYSAAAAWVTRLAAVVIFMTVAIRLNMCGAYHWARETVNLHVAVFCGYVWICF